MCKGDFSKDFETMNARTQESNVGGPWFGGCSFSLEEDLYELLYGWW